MTEQQNKEMSPHWSQGLNAEARAYEYFKSLPSMTILARNYRIRGGEIDLICEESEPQGSKELVFVEVRSRKPGAQVGALESVNGVKCHRLARATRHYLWKYRGGARSVRMDLFLVEGDEVVHVRDAW